MTDKSITLPEFEEWGKVLLDEVDQHLKYDPIYARCMLSMNLSLAYNQGVALGKRQAEEEHKRQATVNSAKRYEL